MADSTVPAASLAHSFDRSQARPTYWPAATFLPPTPTKDSESAPIAPMTAAESKKTCDISNLMSPPEPALLDSFRQVDADTRLAVSKAEIEKRAVPDPPLSPPVSPFSMSASIAVPDPVLYSDADSSPPPLFNTPTAGDVVTKHIIDQHIATRPKSMFRKTTPPRTEDYELAIYLKSSVMKMYIADPRGYFLKERELLRESRKSMPTRPSMAKLPPILPASRPKAQTIKVASGRIQKPKSPKISKAIVPRAIRATPATIRQPARVSVTPEPRSRTVAPNREDKDFKSLPDYCPPLSSLPNRSNNLKVDWKGNPLDLSKDPHAHLLHPDELLLAAGLRLDCATYLTSKRRIFIRRRECLKIGKDFRKTDAQQACKIDVNKASKLWTAYDKVGWLNKEWVSLD
ncbi:hypothetical protein OQA88_4585 [Cercophora sp. LCS_1]